MWFPTDPLTSTTFEGVEEGKVPLLIPLGQIMNIRFSLDSDPVKVYLRSPYIQSGRRIKLKFSTARHVVVYMADIIFTPKSAQVHGFASANVGDEALAITRNTGSKNSDPGAEASAEPRAAEGEELPASGEPNAPADDVAPASVAAASAKPEEDKKLVQNLPPSLLKLHNRLNKEVELYKRHIEHYRMSPAQFKRRTSELALPAEVHNEYELV